MPTLREGAAWFVRLSQAEVTNGGILISRGHLRPRRPHVGSCRAAQL